MNYGNLYALAVLVTTVFLVTTTPATDWLRQVTTDPADDFAPSWSPDGSTLAFTSFRIGNCDIWTIPAGGGTPTQITTDADLDGNPAWSPDGTAIAFDSGRSGNWDVWVIVPEHPAIAPASLGEVKAMFR